MSVIPRKVTVGPYRLTITRTKPATLRELDDQTDTLGHFNHADQTIWVSKAAKGDAAKDVLLHEILHSCWTLGGLRESKASKYEEAVIDPLSQALLGVLRANPDVVAWLVES